MTRESKQATQPRTRKVRRPGRWMVGVVLVAVVVVGGYWIWGKNAAAPEPAPSKLPGPSPSKLIGRWFRPDGGYVLELSDCAPDGVLMAAYFNPRPINVARGEWKLQDGQLRVFVELRDVNYPGSTYTLAYDPATDRLAGVYFQAVQRQRFEVEFQRTR